VSLPDDAIAAAVEIAAAQGEGVDGAIVVKLRGGWSVMTAAHWQEGRLSGRLGARWVGK
jgi:hypothetical protein